MTDAKKDETNPAGLPPHRAGESTEPGPLSGEAEGAAVLAGQGGAVVAPAGAGPATGRAEGDAPAEPTATEATPGTAGPEGGEPAKDGEGRPVTDGPAPRVAAEDAAPASDAEMPVTTVPSADLPLETRPEAGVAVAGLSHAPRDRNGPKPDHEGLDRGLAGLYGFDAQGDRPVWVLWVIGGAALLAGVLALFMPLVATLAAATLTAAMLLLSGIVGLFAAFRREGGGAIAAGVALSLLSVVGGLLMLFVPLAGILAISTVIIAFLAVSGGLKLWYALREREEDMPGRGWMIASGALSLALAVVLWLQLPAAALWLPGLFLAVDLLMYGAMMLALAWHLSRRQSAAA